MCKVKVTKDDSPLTLSDLSLGAIFRFLGDKEKFPEYIYVKGNKGFTLLFNGKMNTEGFCESNKVELVNVELTN